MAIGKDTFGLTKKDFNDKLTKIINNHRVNSRLIGEPRDFILRSCRLYPTWSKLSNDPDVQVYLRNVDIAGGRKVKLISLERGDSRQPVSKAKLLDALYPPKTIKTTATEEERNFNLVKMAMRQGITNQLKFFRDNTSLPTICNITGRRLLRGHKIDVDHTSISFAEIADNFMKEKGLVYTDVVLTGPPTAKIFRDKELWEEWQEYHQDKAILALVSASANRSKGSGDYETPEELYGSYAKKSPEDLALDF
jgi:hypothetical protein